MVVSLILLVLGIVLLVKGADFLVSGAISLATTFGVSKMFIGLSLVAFGTSIPELVVSMIASVKGVPGVSISNVVGSNIANVALCLGIASVIGSLTVKSRTVRLEVPFMILVTIAFSAILLRNNPPQVVWNDGVVFLTFFVMYVYYLYRMAASDMKTEEFKGEGERIIFTVLKVIGGIIGLWIGGDLTVNSVARISETLGISKSLISLTLVAVGTSLPEIATSIMAVRKGEPDITMGNVIGSNIMNILVVIGISSLFGKLTVDVGNYWVDISFMLVFSVLLFLFASTGRKIRKWEGMILIMMYIPYIYFVVSRK